MLRFALLKTKAATAGIEAIDRRAGALHIKFHPGSKIDPARLMELVSARPGAQFTPAGVLKLPLPAGADNAAAVLDFAAGSIDPLVQKNDSVPSVH